MDPLSARAALAVVLQHDLNRRVRGESPRMTGKEAVQLDLAIGSRAGRYLGIATRVDQIVMQASDDEEFDDLVDSSERSDFVDLHGILKKTAGWRRYKALDRGGHLARASIDDVRTWLVDTTLGRWYAIRDNGLVPRMDSAVLKTLPSFAVKRLLEDDFDLSPHLEAFDDICRLLDDLDYVLGIMEDYPRAVVSYDTLDFVARNAEDLFHLEELLERQRDNGHPPPSLEWLSSSMLADCVSGGLWDAVVVYGYQWDVDVRWIHKHFFEPRPDDTVESVWDRAHWIWFRFPDAAALRAMSMACARSSNSAAEAMLLALVGPRNPAEVQLLLAGMPKYEAVDAIMKGGRIDDVPLEWLAEKVKLYGRSYETFMHAMAAHTAWKDVDPDWVLRHLDVGVAIEVFETKGWYNRYHVQDLATMFKTSAYAAFKKSGWLRGIPLDELAQLVREEDMVDALAYLGQLTLDSIDADIRDGDLVYAALRAGNMLDRATPEWMRARIQGDALLEALAHGGHVLDMSDGEPCRAAKGGAFLGDDYMPGVSERVRSLSVARLYTCLGGKRDAFFLLRALELGGHLEHCDPEILFRHGGHNVVTEEVISGASLSPHRLRRYGMQYS